MKAMLLPRYGDPEVFEFGEAPKPAIGSKDILVRVRASCVNPVDCGMRRGWLKAWIRLKFPAILGVDLAGEVVEVGPEVTRFRAGDRVYAYTAPENGGAYAEYASVPEAWAAKIPRGLTMEEAGVVPGVALTAYEAFALHAPIRPDMRILIVGASGGVGTFAVQMAKALGGHVTGVCSGAKAAYVRKLGADAVIDYTKEDVLDTTNRFDVILHGVRDGRHNKMRRLLAKEGRLVIITGSPLTMVAAKVRNLFSKQRIISFYVRTEGANLEEVSKMIERKQVRPVVERTYSWREMAEAHRRVETGRVMGKVAIRMDA